jgi:protein TonB
MHNVVYPELALRNNLTGRVQVRFIVNPRGQVANVEVTQSAHPDLDAAAVQAIEQLKVFAPGRQDGKAIKFYYTVPIKFALK